MAAPEMGGIPQLGKEEISKELARPSGSSLAPDREFNVLRPPVVGGKWLAQVGGETNDRLPTRTSPRLADVVTSPEMPRNHIDKIGSSEDNTDFIGTVAIEAVQADPAAQALVFDLSLTNVSHRIEEQAGRRGIIVVEEGISPAAFMAGTRPEQFADIIEKALHGEEGTRPERGVVREVAGALQEHDGSLLTYESVDKALRYLDERPIAVANTPEELKNVLSVIWSKERRDKLSEDGTFGNVIDLLTILRDNEPEQDTSQPTGRAQIVAFRLPHGQVGSQLELRALLGGRLPQIIGDRFKEGTPAVLGVIDAHALPKADLEAIADLTASKNVGLTVLGFNPTRTPDETLPFIGDNGSIVVTRVPGSVSGKVSEIIGTTHGERQTGRSEDVSVNTSHSQGENGSETKGWSKDRSKSTNLDTGDVTVSSSKGTNGSKTKGWSKDSSVAINVGSAATYEIGELPRVVPSKLEELPSGSGLAFVPGAKRISEKPFNLAIHGATGPQKPLEAQLADAYPGAIPPVETPDALPKVKASLYTSPIARARQGARERRNNDLAKARAERDRLKFQGAVTAAGFRYSDFVTPTGDMVAPTARTEQQQQVLHSLLEGSQEARKGAIKALAQKEGISVDVVNAALARDTASRTPYKEHVKDLVTFEELQKKQLLAGDAEQE
ncbi:MAG: hypothetical protein H0W89_05140 [Candidatus Levybacteria bacterium]|nr:hypothetical protein [Candidatus Levybacteria bacterium]